MAAKLSSRVLTRQRVRSILSSDSSPTTEERMQLETLTRKKKKSSTVSSKTETSSSGENEQENLRKKLESDIWVQCESADCLKWRRLPVEEGRALRQDEPWYCWLALGGTCDVEEEDHRSYDRLADRCKIKYVFSALAPGTLVWATVAGYCRWPGMVTHDPISGLHIQRDQYGHTTDYHVEFFGSQRSHGWVASRYIESYGAATLQKPEKTKPSKRSVIKRTRYKKKKTVRRMKTAYHGTSVESAITEANCLLKVSANDRLGTCVFKARPACEDKSKTTHLRLTGKDLHPVTKGHDVPRKRRSKLIARTVVKRNPSSLTKTSFCIPESSTKRKKTVGMKTSRIKPKTTAHTMKNMAGMLSSNIFGALQNKSASCRGIANMARNIATSCRSREEKYVRDIQCFQQNEALFEHRLVSFMGERGEASARPALWHGIRVTPLQLFLAVHERGGYHKVCNDHQWSAIYEEVTTGIGTKGSSRGQLPKRYYQKNLLAYELYLRNGGSPGIDYHGMESVCDPDNVHDVGDDRQVDIQNMLRHLDSMLEQCSFSYTDQRQQRELERPNVVAFYDESPNLQTQDYQLADTASEFGITTQLPCGALHDAYEDKVRRDIELFHEITAMQAEMDDFDAMLEHMQ